MRILAAFSADRAMDEELTGYGVRSQVLLVP